MTRLFQLKAEKKHTVEVSQPYDDNETNAAVEADEWNDDGWMNAVEEQNNSNEREQEQSDNRVLITDD